MRYKLGEVAKIRYGKDHKKLDDGNIPVYGSGGIMRYVDTALYDKKSVLIPRKGSLGNLFFVNKPFWTVDTLFYTEIDENILMPEFLFYKLKMFNLASMNVGSAVPSLTTAILNALELDIPSFEVQSQIVNILKAFDERISLNKQINHHLEELAQAIFRSWFIDFEPFDGIKPSDWEIASLTDIADYLNGLAMQKFRPEKDENSLPVLKIKELRQGAFDKTSDICSANIKPEYIINDGDVIFSWSGSLLVDFWTGGIGGLNQHLFKVSSQNYDKWFYYSWTKYYLQEFINIAADKATTMGHITRSSLENAKILIPNAKDYEMISSILVPIYDDIIQNRIASRKLAQLRDEILPKLLSGELSINYNTK